MRLIDADALTIDLFKKAMDDALLTGNADMHMLLIKVIAHYPTVDAIPVEWIEEQIRESYEASKEYDGCYDFAWALSELVKRWRVENGTVD